MAKHFEILRVKKIRGGGSLAAAFAHCTRERTTLNADANLLGENRISDFTPVGDGKETGRLMAKHREMLQGCRVQAKANTCLEYLITASPEIMSASSKEGQNYYFSESRKWLEKKHGTGNIIACFVHRDEQNPHMHVFVVPKLERKDKWGNIVTEIGANTFTNGRKKLSQMQTDFHEAVGVRFNLERGVIGSTAKHDQVKRIYAKINQVAELVNEQVILRTKQLEENMKKWKDFAGDLKKLVVTGNDNELEAQREYFRKQDKERARKQEDITL